MLTLSPASKSVPMAQMPISSRTMVPGSIFSCFSCGWKGNCGWMLLLSSILRCEARRMPMGPKCKSGSSWVSTCLTLAFLDNHGVD